MLKSTVVFQDGATEGSVHMLLLRIAFWVAVVALLLPAAPSIDNQNGGLAQAAGLTDDEGSFDAGQAVDLALSTGSDVFSFCERNRSVCDAATSAGSHVMAQLVYYSGEAATWAAQTLIDARAPQTAANAAPGANVQFLAPAPSAVPAPAPGQPQYQQQGI